MKNILVLLLFAAFSLKATAQVNLDLPVIKNLSSIDSKTSFGLESSFSNSLSTKNTAASKSVFENPKTLKAVNSNLKENAPQNNSVKKKSPFRFNITPYFWAAGIVGTVSVPGIPQPYPQDYNLNISFSQIWKNIHLGFMVNGNFRYGNWALLYDIIYINLKGFDAYKGNSDSIFSANTSNQQLLMDYAVSYFVPLKSKTIFINPYAGVRVTGIKSEITLTDNINDSTFMTSGDFTWVDPIIGLNAELDINPLYSYYKLDIGGFGINSHFSINFVGGLGYRFSPSWDLSLGYKVLGTNYHKKNKWDVSEGGLLLALGYRFNP